MAERTETINAQGIKIGVVRRGDDDYISLTDIARYKSDEPSAVIANWMRLRATVDYLGVWERLNNPEFNSLEFEGIEAEAGRNSFSMSPRKWIKLTNAIGIRSKGGRYGGTYAHTDIAFDFASWISPEFKLYVIKDYQRLKADENNRLSLDWSENELVCPCLSLGLASHVLCALEVEATIYKYRSPRQVSSRRKGPQAMRTPESWRACCWGRLSIGRRRRDRTHLFSSVVESYPFSARREQVRPKSPFYQPKQL